MPELRISDVPPGVPGAGRRVEVTWQDGPARRVAVADIDAAPDERDGELVRWYLEDYAESPADPAPALAASAETLLAREGADLFRRVFSSRDAIGIWERARDRLAEVRVEVDADPGEGPGLAWELLRDPDRDAALALSAGTFVRTHLRAAGHPDLPQASGDRLRVLLVICRPGGRDDVPFRSVASRLVRGGAEQMEGLELDVLRPATFPRLAQALQAAKKAGRPYHVVHFDGHGTYLDVARFELSPDAGPQGNGGGTAPGGSGMGGGSASQGAGNGHGSGIDLSPLRYGLSVAGPVRPGQHGYLLFEAPADAGGPGDPDGTENMQLVDGPALGRLLTETGVPVLVLNACRSAYAEARSQPGGPGADGTDQSAAEGASAGETPDADLVAGDVHARIRAYGSLAAEVADAGVPGVIAMRYNVYVVTAAQFVADLYAHLLSGRSLGEAATEARRALARDPGRQIGASEVSLQDWAVPVVYEAAPLTLLRPANRTAPVVRLTNTDTLTAADGNGPDGLPRPPDAGFFGRDETLLALDRTFDTQQLVLLHAFAGAGKSSTATEFARWYRATGGLNHPDHPDWGPGPVLWSSFEHHLTSDQAVGMAGDHFAALLEANSIPWAAVTDPAQRRDLVLQLLAKVPALWVWDNVEPVAGFPAGTPSVWTQQEQDELAALLRDLTQQTQCKVLLTSRRDERDWLRDLPSRVQLRRMPMRESLQLAAALAVRHDRTITAADWRPLLRFAAGNPLTITVVTGQVLRENLATAEEIAGFVARLQAGQAQLESGQDAALGRNRSLAASLDYGFARAFTPAERAHLAVLHLFRDTVNVSVLSIMGNLGILGDDAVPELAGLDVGTWPALLDRAADIGLLAPLGRQMYQIHPALPWYFTVLFTATYGDPGEFGARRAARGYVVALGHFGRALAEEANSGRTDQLAIVAVLEAEESNLLYGVELARSEGLVGAAVNCMQGLRILYERTGRNSELARLISVIALDVTDPGTGGPLPGWEDQWCIVTGYRSRLAAAARDWPAATSLTESIVKWLQRLVAEVPDIPSASLSYEQRAAILNLQVVHSDLGDILHAQDDPGCLPHYLEALSLAQRAGDPHAEAARAGSLSNAYLTVPDLRDLDQAERWLRYGLGLRDENDRLGRGINLSGLATVAFERFQDARAAGQPQPVLLRYLNDALNGYREALDLAPSDDHESRAIRENQIGIVYAEAGDVAQALRHLQRGIQHEEARGHTFGAGQTRFNVAILLDRDGRVTEALRYAHAALSNFRSIGTGADALAARAERLIAYLGERANQ